MARTLTHLIALLLFGYSALTASAADKGIYTDPANAGPDYAFQGEYLGAAGDEKMGVQVIALGGGKFEMVAHRGGLPGAGWKRGDDRVKAKGETKDGTVVFTHEGKTATIKKGEMMLADSNGKVVTTLKKVERKSPTLGAKPPKNATVLFDGKSAENFKGGKIVMNNLLLAACETKAKFGDHTLHLEFRTPFKPTARGQGRGNSGVYIQNRYECQVLDSFGLDGKNNECGGIYSIAQPKVNMCFPPLTWQTYDIDFTAAKYDGNKKVKNARVTIRHNGVAIHDDLELPHGTPGKNAEGAGPDGLYLQGHGNPVVFRNIWVVEKK